MNRSIKIDQLDSEVQKIIKSYVEGVHLILRDETDEIAKGTLQAVKDAAPVDKGRYKKSIRDKKVKDSSDEIIHVIHASGSEYRKTHLLEHGHAIANGTGRTKPQPHWAKGQEFIDKHFEKNLKGKIENES